MTPRSTEGNIATSVPIASSYVTTDAILLRIYTEGERV
jgi:hypothetical protein